MSTVGFAFEEAGRSLWRNRGSSVLAVLTIAVALFVVGVFAAAWVNAQRALATLQETAEVSIYLADAVTSDDRQQLEQALGSAPEVRAHRFVSREEARRRFAETFPDLASAAGEGAEHVLPASYEVRLRVETSRDQAALDAFAVRLQEMPGVVDVRYDRRWLDRLDRLAAAARTVGVLLSIVLALGAALTVTSVVRLALYARRQEIEIMQLVGAPQAAIRGPFVLEGALQGALGALVALAAVYGAQVMARGALAGAEGVLPDGAGGLALLPWTWALGVLAGGVLVGCAGGVIATRHTR